MKIFIVLLMLMAAGGLCLATDGVRLEGFDYPYPVQVFQFTSQKQHLEMAYMDVRPTNAEADTVVLLHGKNFSGAYWGETAAALQKSGFRVIIPDAIGFGKSSNPQSYQFSFGQLASNLHELLHSCGVKQAQIVGHSMGGMIATRYALMYPTETKTLVLADPIGLEDWQAKGVPYVPVDKNYQNELKQTPETIRSYERENYYHGEWRPEYDRWVDMVVRFQQSTNYPLMAWDQALASDMIFTQPVCHEFKNLKMPVLLIIGQADRTAIGKEQASAEVKKTLGDYPKLGRDAAAIIPAAKLVELDGIGHLPQVEAFP
ncbi:MAG TPA: alpha/beta hydrolase, partial [Verrucomicrobiae bacterium]|nr:alpha/beta hydrolase [Verrucomicrobiae bacterium]